MDIDDMEEYLKQAVDGVIECPECGNNIEPDAEKCPCGWVNPVRANGFI